MRSSAGDEPSEILTHLTHLVWRAYESAYDASAVDPHFWPVVLRTLRDVFKNRLSYNPLCGRRDECRSTPGAFPDEPAPPVDPNERVFLLETHLPIERFFKVMGWLLARRLTRGHFRISSVAFGAALGRALRGALRVSEVCRSCPARESMADRRVWAREFMEQPWGGWRPLCPEEVPIGRHREDW